MKCKYRKQCPHFSKESPTCMKDGGMYYAFDKPAGCYREMEKKSEKQLKNKLSEPLQSKINK